MSASSYTKRNSRQKQTQSDYERSGIWEPQLLLLLWWLWRCLQSEVFVKIKIAADLRVAETAANAKDVTDSLQRDTCCVLSYKKPTLPSPHNCAPR